MTCLGTAMARSDRNERHDQLLQRWPAMVKGKVATGTKDTYADREYEVKIRVIAETSRRNPYT
jgi:hypothetical protein